MAKTGKYKFYLAFENSICKEYITEKPAKALLAGLVPVVYGAVSSEEYHFFPPNSYIDTRNFTSPQSLAGYLKHLDEHHDEYLAFHAWRSNYEIKYTDRWCKLCNALYNTSDTSESQCRNVDWSTFWTTKSCKFDLLNELTWAKN